MGGWLGEGGVWYWIGNVVARKSEQNGFGKNVSVGWWRVRMRDCYWDAHTDRKQFCSRQWRGLRY